VVLVFWRFGGGCAVDVKEAPRFRPVDGSGVDWVAPGGCFDFDSACCTGVGVIVSGVTLESMAVGVEVLMEVLV
jgi:hypothetical protein